MHCAHRNSRAGHGRYASALLPRVAAVYADRAGWHRRATDAVVNEFSTEEPTADKLAEAARDLVLQTVEVTVEA